MCHVVEVLLVPVFVTVHVEPLVLVDVEMFAQDVPAHVQLLAKMTAEISVQVVATVIISKKLLVVLL